MIILTTAVRAVTKTAQTTTAAAGAVGGAVVNGAIGGLQGTAAGVRTGLSEGSKSIPAAALTLAALGAAGLVEWPLLVTVGGAALLVRQLAQRHDREGADESAPEPPKAATKATQPSATKATQPSAKKATQPSARKATKPAVRKPAKSPAKASVSRRAAAR
jgi:hypothetical protein